MQKKRKDFFNFVTIFGIFLWGKENGKEEASKGERGKWRGRMGDGGKMIDESRGDKCQKFVFGDLCMK